MRRRAFRRASRSFKPWETARPELILLDVIAAGGEDGVTILGRLRRDPRFSAIPVIMITAKGEEGRQGRGVGVRRGLDLRDQALWHDGTDRPRQGGHSAAAPGAARGVLTLGGNPPRPREAHRVEADGKEVVLTFREFELLRYLMEHPEKAFDRDRLLDEVWGAEYEGGPRTVDMHVQTIRKKLGRCASQIETIYGLGYKDRRGGTIMRSKIWRSMALTAVLAVLLFAILSMAALYTFFTSQTERELDHEANMGRRGHGGAARNFPRSPPPTRTAA